MKKNIEQKEKIAKIEKWILDECGIVKEVKDGIVIVEEGLNNVGMSEMVEFIGKNVKGIVYFLGKEKAITILGGMREIEVGDFVKKMNILPFINVSKSLLGRVVNPLGEAVDGLGAIKEEMNVNIEKKAPGIIERESVKTSLETGIKFIDSMIPIGRGQRELIIGDPKTGKTTIGIDTIINQKGKGLICVYVAIGQKQTSLLKIVKVLKKKNV